MAKKRPNKVFSNNPKSKNEDSFLENTLEYAEKFHMKFRKEVVTSVVAAFGFLIALSWRKPIEQFVNLIIETFRLEGNEIYIQILSALIVTLIAVLGIMIISKWEFKKDEASKNKN